MDSQFGKLVDAFRRRHQLATEKDFLHPIALALPGGRPAVVGQGEPEVTLVVNNLDGLRALSSFDVLRVGNAYLSGALDVKGDLSHALGLRSLFQDRHPLLYLHRLIGPILTGQVRSDAAWIADHYNEDPDFFTLFLDRRHRCYSQAVFASEQESLEDAMTRKLDFALDAIGVEPGARVLDIGAGWGAFTEYAGQRGIRVTSLTISEPSRRFVQRIIDRGQLPCEVILEHLYDHRPAEPYDAIVNLGVTEHLPDYARTIRCYERLLRPGGHIYLDASACRRKGDVSTFFERNIFPGNGSPLCLHDYLQAISNSGLEVRQVINDRENYLLTSRAWARALDDAREEIESRWGMRQFRRFQVYLWGCVDGFRRDVIQAYRLVLRSGEISMGAATLVDGRRSAIAR